MIRGCRHLTTVTFIFYLPFSFLLISHFLLVFQMRGKFEVEPTGKPGEAIVKFAEEKKVTMVIMGTRGLGSIRRTIMGSVSDYVVHHAHCPVIVCRPKK